MIEPISTTTLASAALAIFTHHSPWLADKVGGAAVSQAIRESWDLVKRKLTATPEGETAVQTVEQHATSLEELRPLLLASLESDPSFRDQLGRLIINGSDNQTAQGNSNKQAKVTGSEGVTIIIA